MPHADRQETAPDWIVVPPRKLIEQPSASSKYGAGWEAAKYCGLDQQQFSNEKFIWKHGWRPDYVATADPVYTAQKSLDDTATTIYVARQLEADFLHESGYHNARAIGMPICYADRPNVSRRPNSLLVMPVHSLDTTAHVWPFMQYADTIAALKSEFDEIVVCLHPSCIKHGYWIDEFKSHGIGWLSGADTHDLNSLSRVRHLCSQFEFVTTNGLNSSIAYAAADGAKVSVYGPYCKIDTRDVEHVPFYSQNPGLAEKILPLLAEQPVRAHLPQFFCHPREAQQCIEWGRQQLGEDCKPSAQELRQLLFNHGDNQNPLSDAADEAREHPGRIEANTIERDSRPAPRRNRPAIDSSLDQATRTRLSDMAENESGTVKVGDDTLHFVDSARFLVEFEQTFDRQLFEFPCIYTDPLLFDGCAGHGLMLRYWLSRLSGARIVAVEQDARTFEALAQNTSRYSDERVVLKNEKPETQFGLLESGEVEFLRLDLKADELEPLHQLAQHLTRIKRLCLNYHCLLDQPQAIATVLQTLEHHGFRYHLVHDRSSVSHRPFMRLRVHQQLEQTLTIWAWQGERFPRIRAT